MARIIRHEFLGSELWVVFLCLTGIGIPMAITYLISSTISIEEEIDNPNEFLKKYRSGSLRK